MKFSEEWVLVDLSGPPDIDLEGLWCVYTPGGIRHIPLSKDVRTAFDAAKAAGVPLAKHQVNFYVKRKWIRFGREDE